MTGSTHDLFAVIAEAAATLTGLLFVAMSVAPRRPAASHLGVVQQVRAAASLLAFTSALAVSIFGLVPGNNVGYPATVLGVVGLLFTAAGMRSIVESTRERGLLRRQLGLVILLLLTFGFELGCGIALILHGHSRFTLDLLGNVLAASLLIGVACAWELVGERDTGLFSSIAVLSGRAGGPDSGGSGAGGGGPGREGDPPEVAETARP